MRAVVRKELLSTLRDRQLGGAVALVAALYLGALALAWGDHRRAHAEQRQAAAEVRRAWLAQGERNPHDAGHWGTLVFKPPHPLGIIERGALDYMGDRVQLETHTQNDAQHRRAKEATSLFRLGGFTPAQVFLLLVPLLLLVLTHASVCGEDEGGTAAMLRATGVGPRTVHRGKVVGALLLMLAWVVPLLLATGIAVLTAPGANADTALSFALAAAAFLVYSAGFVLVGITVSALARTPRDALAVSFGVWAAVCVAVPRAAASVAEAAVPAPSAYAFKRAVEAARDNKWDIAYKARANFRAIYSGIERELIAEQGVAADALTVDPFGLAIEATEEEGQRAYDATFRRVLDVFRRQDDIRRGFAVASTPVALSAVTASLADADLASHLHFLDAAEAYRRAMMRTLNMDIALNARRRERHDVSRTGFDGTYTRGRDLWETIPAFVPPERAPARALAAAAPEAGSLLLWLIASLLVSRWAVRRRWSA